MTARRRCPAWTRWHGNVDGVALVRLYEEAQPRATSLGDRVD
jgi:hypothetical protein